MTVFEFNGPVNTAKVLWSRSVNLISLFLGPGLDLQTVNQYLCTYFRQLLKPAIFESRNG